MPSESNHSPGTDAVAREIFAAPVSDGNADALCEILARSQAAVIDWLSSLQIAKQQDALLEMSQQQADALHRLLNQSTPDQAMPCSLGQGDGVRGSQQEDTTP